MKVMMRTRMGMMKMMRTTKMMTVMVTVPVIMVRTKMKKVEKAQPPSTVSRQRQWKCECANEGENP